MGTVIEAVVRKEGGGAEVFLWKCGSIHDGWRVGQGGIGASPPFWATLGPRIANFGWTIRLLPPDSRKLRSSSIS